MTKISDIILTSPPSRAFNHYRPPMALLSLAGYLLKNKVKVKIIDITDKNVIRDKKFWDNVENHRLEIESQLLSEYSKNPANIVGITCYTPEYYEVLDLAKKIKLINPKAKIIVGGIHPTLYPQELLMEANSPIDFEVIGEGEETLLELVKKIIKHTRDFSQIKGIAYLKKQQYIQNLLRPVNENLDELYHPAFHLIDMEYYTTPSPYAIRGCFLRSFYLLATRGCPSTCTFCVAKKLRCYNGGGKYTRIRSAKSLLKEIDLLRTKYNIDSFYFIDDLFTINVVNVQKFCQELKVKHPSLIWGCSAKVSTLNENVLRTMSQAGCVQIDFGVERGSDKALVDIQKGINLKMIRNIFGYCHQFHIRTFANYLINLPRETKKDLQDILNLLDELRSDIVSINVFCPYPGTEIYDNHTYKFSKEEYIELFNSADLIKKYPQKYRFASHRVDMLKWATKYNHQYNNLSNFILFHLSPKYLQTFLYSHRKTSYVFQLKNLVSEYINQTSN